jgi:GntR family transcriptional regulator
MIEVIQARLAAARSASGPKYQALRSAIVGAISGGELKPGTRLPTEAELANVLPYSLGTVQKAYGELVKSGLIERARGRGTFVAPPDRQMSEPWHCRFLADDGTILPIYPRLLGHKIAGKDPRWEQLFSRRGRIIRIDRAISVNREFEIISRFFTPDAIAKLLLRRPPDKIETANFKTILLRELGMPITRIVQTVRTTDMNLSRRSPNRSMSKFILEAIAYSAEGEAVYLQEFRIPSTRRKLLFDSQLR